MKSKSKRKLIIGGIILVVIILAIIFLTRSKAVDTYTTVPVVQGNLTQTVSDVGTVQAATSMDLNFATVGRLNKILVKVGVAVKKDQILAELDYSALLIKEQGAQADLAVADATLKKLLAGATPADIAIYSAQVNQAQVGYNTAVNNFSKTQAAITESIRQAQKRLNDLQADGTTNITPEAQAVTTATLNLSNTTDSYAQARANNQDTLLTTIDSKISAAQTAVDYVNRIISDTNLKNSLSVQNPSYLNSANDYYVQTLALKNPAVIALATARANETDANLQTAATQALNYLNQAYKTVNECFLVLSSSVVTSDLSQTTLDTFKTNISADATTVNAGVAAVQSANYTYSNSVLAYNNNVASAQSALDQAKINLDTATKNAANALATAQKNGDQQLATAQAQADSAKQAAEVAQAQLAKIKTPARSEDVDLARAQLNQAQANLDLIEKQKADNQILAPIDGQITAVNYSVGEQPTAAQPVISMLTQNNFEVEADISETDISKVKINDAVAITLDAYGDNQKFNGQVYFIDPASTVIQDVIYYKVKIKFTDDLQTLTGLKAGMTANAVITTNNRENILIVPGRSIVDKDGQGKFVRILQNNKVVEIPVTVGLSGDDGLVEVSATDLHPGDQAITFVKTAGTP